MFETKTIVKRLVVGTTLLLSTGAWGGFEGWGQWGQSAAHDGQGNVHAQRPTNELAHFVYDPFEGQEMVEGGGDLYVHYPAPLNDTEGNFFMLEKQGTYTACDPPGSG